MAGLQRVLCVLNSRDSWYSEYTSGCQCTKSFIASLILICQSFTGYIGRVTKYLGFQTCQSSEYVLETTLE